MIDQLTEFIPHDGYSTVEEWALDSDYHTDSRYDEIGQVWETVWLDEDGNEADILASWNTAMQASATLIGPNTLDYGEVVRWLAQEMQIDGANEYESVITRYGRHALDWGFDFEGDEYVIVGWNHGIGRVFVEIEDGTFGHMNGLRIFTGRKEYNG